MVTAVSLTPPDPDSARHRTLPDNECVPPTSASATPPRHTAGPAATRDDLARLRPDLTGRYDAALPGARAAVLSRLLGALDREQLPGITGPAAGRGEVTLADGTALRFPAEAARAFAQAQAGLAISAWPAIRQRPGDPQAGPGSNDGPSNASTRSDDTNGRHGDDAPWGRHHRASPGGEPAELRTGENSGRDDEPLAAWTGSDPGTLVRMLWPGSPLADEIDNSVANMALARAAALPPRIPSPGKPGEPGEPGEPGDPDALAAYEQMVVDGHPLHPCCRTRGGMTVQDVLTYAPEHHPTFRLRRLRVPPDRWYGDTEPVLHAHPWQADRLRQRYPWLVPDGDGVPVRPLMSLRTVAPVGGGPHVKTAVDVQMTSAVRTVSPAAVHNGPLLSALLRTLTEDLPIGVLAETAAGAVLVDGVAQRHLAYLVREAPVVQAGESVLPLGVLAVVPALIKGIPDAYVFLSELSRVMFAPLCTLLARGVALEAHGQNTLVVLRENRPVRILYRDLGGVRVSAARLRAVGVHAPELAGDLPSDDPRVLRTKVAASAFGTVAAQLVAAFTQVRGDDPDRLWQSIVRQIPKNPETRRLLTEPLPIKATTAMRLAADPLDDVWAYVDNPMAA